MTLGARLRSQLISELPDVDVFMAVHTELFFRCFEFVYGLGGSAVAILTGHRTVFSGQRKTGLGVIESGPVLG